MSADSQESISSLQLVTTKCSSKTGVPRALADEREAPCNTHYVLTASILMRRESHNRLSFVQICFILLIIKRTAN